MIELFIELVFRAVQKWINFRYFIIEYFEMKNIYIYVKTFEIVLSKYLFYIARSVYYDYLECNQTLTKITLLTQKSSNWLWLAKKNYNLASTAFFVSYIGSVRNCWIVSLVTNWWQTKNNKHAYFRFCFRSDNRVWH